MHPDVGVNVRTNPLEILLFAIPLSLAGCSDDDDGDFGDAADEVGDGDGDGDRGGDNEGEPEEDEDEPEQYECSPKALDACPPDMKCTATTAPDGQTFDYECVMDRGRLGPGELCEPSPPTGVDGCPSGYACIPDTNLIPTEGHCLELCVDDEGCDDGLCAARFSSPIRVCADYCNPLLATCPATQACRMLEDRAFGCVTPMPDDIGVQGAPCDGVHQVGCANGFVCLGSFEVHDCYDSDYCCTALCPFGGESECPEQTTCQLLTLDQSLHADVGACTL